MARTLERLAVARRALATLESLLAEDAPAVPDSTIVRDAAIQRFEYTFEAVWKTAQQYLRDVEGLEVASPRSTVRASFQVGVLGKTETKRALAMVDDRNLSVHTCNEALAETIFSRLTGHAEVMAAWLDALEQGTNQLLGEA